MDLHSRENISPPSSWIQSWSSGKSWSIVYDIIPNNIFGKQIISQYSPSMKILENCKYLKTIYVLKETHSTMYRAKPSILIGKVSQACLSSRKCLHFMSWAKVLAEGQDILRTDWVIAHPSSLTALVGIDT